MGNIYSFVKIKVYERELVVTKDNERQRSEDIHNYVFFFLL